MKKESIILIIVFTFPVIGISQTESETIPEICTTTISQENQGNSYITFPTDIGNIEPLWFEGNIMPNFNIRRSKNSRLMGVITPQIIIRMYQEESYPVKTPSYIPQLTVYYSLSSKQKVNSLNLFGRYAHHSNGQKGDFYLDNGEINLENGNFATNYFELGVIKTNYNARYNAVQFFATSFEFHPESLTYEELIGLYSLYRWNATFSIFKLPGKSESKNATISIKGKTTWMFGNVNDWDVFSLKRLNFSFTFYYHPKFMEDIGIFTQFYHGMDYYNIYFNHQITVLRFGIMTELLRF
jgi:hypothetical protein